MKGRMWRWVLCAVAVLTLSSMASAQMELLGAGATFPYPLYSKMFDAYTKQTGVKVNYQSIGSGGGIRQLLNRTIDFAGSDAIMKDEDMAKLPGGEGLHIPMALGAVVVAYNLPELGDARLKLTPDVIADIYLGKIRWWNDERIRKINPGVDVPARGIVVVHRSDGSGTTFIFTSYLSRVSKEWKEKVGAGTAVKWPVGVGGKGNEGVSGMVKQLPGAIGYMEFNYAKQNKIPVAEVMNRKGKFVAPSVESVAAAADVEMPDHARVMIVDTEAEDGYPISGFTWIIVPKEQKYEGRTFERARALVDLLWWMLHDGQAFHRELDYGPITGVALKKAEALVKSIQYDGKPIIQ